jgi:tetratricopeptide (TPR) repeat protein/SAM-dependent methyltransferase
MTAMKTKQRKTIPQNRAEAAGARAEAEFVEVFNKGMELQKSGKLEEAVTAFRKALALNPNHPVVFNNLAAVLASRGELEEALALYRKALAVDPALAFTYSNMSDTLTRLGRYDEALAAATRASVLDPSSPDAHNNVGSALLEVARFDEAIVALEKSLALKPDFAFAHSNIGNAMRGLGRLDEAITAFEKAVELGPHLAVAHKNLGLTRLQKGDYRGGWPEYGWRWQADGHAPRDYPQPLWKGGPLSGKTLLLYTEQGLGDAIQFARFIPYLAAPDVRIVLEVHPQLIGLMGTLRGVAEIIPAWGTVPHFDTYLPIMDIPGVLGLTPDTIPHEVPYLSAQPERVAKWRERIGAHGFKVGIAWEGFAGTPRKKLRSAALSCFAPLADIEGVRLISLQKQAPGKPADPFIDQLGVETLGPDFDSGADAFVDTAALMESLDLIVTIDTSVGHLAGALARPVWIALTKVPDWRWKMEGRDSIWYPTVQLFRQAVDGEWPAVFADIAGELAQRVAGATVIPGPTKPRQPAPVALASGARDFSRLQAFIDSDVWDSIPELAAEPHISITRTTIESLREQGLLLPGMRLLDIGCGDGLALGLFHQLDMEASGIAGSIDAEACRAKGFDVQVMDQNVMDFADASFDVLWSRQALQRSAIPLFTLREYARIIKPSGLIHVDVPATDTDFKHERNLHYHSVLPAASWLTLFASAGLAVEKGCAINHQAGGKTDSIWSFQLRLERNSRPIR